MVKKGKIKDKGYNIEVYKEWCKGCGICVAFCPGEVLVQDEMGFPSPENPEKCLSCHWCEVHCPDFAISLKEEKEERRKKKPGPRQSRHIKAPLMEGT